MSVLAIAAIVLIGLVVIGPQIWVQYVIARHGDERTDFPGTGGELAEHLIGELGLKGVGLERTDLGDHYDPRDAMVRLGENHHGGRSISAVAIAAHEIGHAIQHQRGEKLLALRNRLVALAAVTDRIAAIFFIAAPVLAIAARTPVALFALAGIGIALLGVRVIVHLVTLPVEFDASFNKALPILEQGGYLKPEDMPAARQVLKAAALTYVAGALMSLIDLARWIRLLR